VILNQVYIADTAEAGDLEFERLWPPLKGVSIKKNYIGKLHYPIAITITQKYRGCLRIGDFKVEYLREF
jgi:hypothetical protein